MSQLSQSFSKIYEQYVNKIYRFIYLKVNSKEVAQDLTSEVFTRGWQTYCDKKQKIENVTAFLYQIARNLIVDHYRQKGRAQFVSVDNMPQLINPDVNLEEDAVLKSDLYRVRASLANIREDYREVIIWYYLEELSVPEISKILGKSQEAVRVQIHRALNSLRNDLQE